MKIRLVVAGALTAAALSGCGAAAPDVTTDPKLPDEVAVTCSPSGISVGTHSVVTRPAGVSLRITSTLSRGSYLTYRSTGIGGPTGGDPIQPGVQSWTLTVAPGTITVGCDPVGEMGQGKKTTFQVSDPDGNWRGTRDLDAHGCAGGGLIDWAVGFVEHAPSAQSAAEAVASEFQARNRRDAQFTVTPLAVGYRANATQTWLLMKAGAPFASVLVTEVDGRYTARPDASCTAH